MSKYLPVNFYKPTKSIKGSMLQLTIRPAKSVEENGKNINTEGFVYLSFAPQVAEKKFDYDKKVVLKLNSIECADILKCLRTKTSTKIFHSTESRTLSMTLDPFKDEKTEEIKFNLSGNMKDSKGSQGFYYRLDSKEAEAIKTLLDIAIVECYRVED